MSDGSITQTAIDDLPAEFGDETIDQMPAMAAFPQARFKSSGSILHDEEASS